MGNLAERHGIETIMGKPGGVTFIHCNLVHGSSTNISPWPRAILYINYNSVENIPTGGNDRAWFHNNPNREALKPVAFSELTDLTWKLFGFRHRILFRKLPEGACSDPPADWWHHRTYSWRRQFRSAGFSTDESALESFLSDSSFGRVCMVCRVPWSLHVIHCDD